MMGALSAIIEYQQVCSRMKKNHSAINSGEKNRMGSNACVYLALMQEIVNTKGSSFALIMEQTDWVLAS